MICACGNTWTTGSTKPEIRTDVCSNCHPFFTGEQRIVDTEGQVDRFLKRLKAREERSAATEARQAARVSLTLPLSELDIPSRTLKTLEAEGVVTAGDFLNRLNDGGDEGLLAIKGFGHKGLIDVKRYLRARGYDVPGAEEE